MAIEGSADGSRGGPEVPVALETVTAMRLEGRVKSVIETKLTLKPTEVNVRKCQATHDKTKPPFNIHHAARE
jgi:hypothetical protein